MRYIALLRGVNVGGKNILSMAALKAAWEDSGFTRVATYINSGNVLFDSREEDILRLQDQCRALLKTGFDVDVPLAIITAPALLEALAQAPPWWNNDSAAKHNAIFVIPPATAEEVCAAVGESKPQYESVAYHGPLIFWSAALKTFSRTRWSKITASAIYGSTTIRNANTALKLAELARQG